ncbi:MAG: peptidylprolyl isomerase [Bacilli bacterium]|nr:peptidylprolyl isomerase [Bacilli bacterium]
MKKKILIALLILGCTAGCGKVPKLSNGKEAVVSFEDTKISISADDLYNEIKEKYALSSLIDMIDNSILLKEYPKSDSDAKKYADEQLESIKKYYVDDDGKYDEKSLLSALSQYYGISSLDGFKEMLKLTYYRNKAVDDYAKNSITDKQVQKYYDEEYVGDISCKHILIAPKTTDSMSDAEKKKAEEAALKTAKEVIKKLNDGAKFDDLAKEYSDDDSNKDKGGDLGYFNKGDMVTEFETAAYALKLNKYTTTPVKTKFGYHIILKTGAKEKEALDKVKDTIITTLADKAKEDDNTMQINALVELRKKYGMKIEDSSLSKQYSNYISNQILQAQSNKTSK